MFWKSTKMASITNEQYTDKYVHYIFVCVLMLCTQVIIMFLVLLWVYIHTGQAIGLVSQRSRVRFPLWSG